MQLSFRWKLTLWYSGIVALSLILFSWILYLSVRTSLYNSLDVSLKQDAEYIHRLLQTKLPQYKTLPKLKRKERKRLKDEFAPDKDQEKDSTTEESAEERAALAVWGDVYRHVLLNPKNNLVQVKNEAGEIVYRSDNLGNDTINYPSIPKGMSLLDMSLDDRSLRVVVLDAPDMDIAVGYPIGDIKSILNKLFSMLIYLGPGVLLVAILGGWLLARAALKPINEIVRTTKDITAHNLEQRIPEPQEEDEMRRLVQTLNGMIDRLQTSFAQITQFTADASHELRTPLTILTGELELAIRTEQSPDAYRRTLSSALDEVLRLSNIVNKLLLLSRAEAGQLDVQHEPVHLKPLLQEVVEDAEVLASPKNIAVRFNAEKDFVVSGDDARLHELFLNLVDNAIKYSNQGALLDISLARLDGRAIVTVKDTGIGISPEDLAKIFDRFYRVDKARSRKIGGSGLGLSIVKWIVDAHDGTITVQSVPGEGSEFVVTFPVQA